MDRCVCACIFYICCRLSAGSDTAPHYTAAGDGEESDVVVDDDMEMHEPDHMDEFGTL